MKIKQLLVPLSFLTLLMTTQVTSAKDMVGWKVMGNGSGIVEGQKYSLYNLDQKDYLGYKDRRGANLGWDSQPNSGMKIKRQSGSGAIKCGEKFALFIEKEWVIYDQQTTGINLSTRTQLADDRYQWKFSNCQSGEVIQLNKPVTLVNTVENDSVVGCKRVWGVNLCWADTVFTYDAQNYHKDAIPSWIKDKVPVPLP
ncbi:hypothetical protein [Calothrix sp. NIES-3974]|uniref:hypothetical protein n=1 Tax=Calothrix sp. NIES-3974 TaxID=2005462 RepID=UPI000B5FB761|nr:hypothetical protein [Calothrix sp. NIES-3974]BAZ06608.1 hypothetical protein NIES3974_32690 [Calothrix sp. NIES-3974]